MHISHTLVFSIIRRACKKRYENVRLKKERLCIFRAKKSCMKSVNVKVLSQFPSVPMWWGHWWHALLIGQRPTKPYGLQKISALSILKHPRLNRGGQLPYQYLSIYILTYYTLICMMYILVILHCFTDHFVNRHIHTHVYVNVCRNKHWSTFACNLNLPRGVLQNSKNPPQLLPRFVNE